MCRGTGDEEGEIKVRQQAAETTLVILKAVSFPKVTLIGIMTFAMPLAATIGY